jgi:hypothetical protein
LGQLGLEQGLAETSEAAVAEDPEAAFDEPVLHAVALAALSGEEANQGLPDGQPSPAHGASLLWSL